MPEHWKVTWEAHIHNFTKVGNTVNLKQAMIKVGLSCQKSCSQSKSRFVRTSGATSVQTYNTMPIQLEDFHPDCCPLTFHLTRRLIPVPVGKGHHDIK